MSEGFEIIRARTKDDTAVLIDRLMKSKHIDVVLVLPKNSILAADLNSLKILKEEAESVGKNLFLSTENNEIKTFAEKIQLLIYNSAPPKKEEINFSKPAKKELKRMLDIVPPSAPVIYEITNEDIASELNKNNDNDSKLEKNLEDFYNEPKSKSDNKFPAIGSKKLISFNRIVASFVGMGVLFLATAMYLILPKANIRISLKEVPIKVAIPVAISKNISLPNLANGIIPGQYFLLSKSGSKIIKASKTSDESGNLPLKTGGLIYIYNAYSTAPQKLVAQTRFETKDGKIFRIQNPIIVPVAKMSGTKLIPSSIKAEVISDEVGEEYQIGPSYFTIPGFKESPKYAGFYAKSTELMIPERNNPTISNQEIEKTKKNLEDELASELKNDTLTTFKDSDFKLIDGASTVKIDNFKADSQAISMKIIWQAIFFKEKDFKALVDYSVSNKYPDLKNFDFENNITYPQVTRSDFKKGEIFFTFELDKANAFTADLTGLKKELAGLDENGMRNIISNKNFINSATISLWPFWVKQAPGSPDKINIILDKQ
ncbi:MAG: hypothetical protein AAB789_00930 [Patescibacteria group bacterium]